jgi:hypothetical protein
LILFIRLPISRICPARLFPGGLVDFSYRLADLSWDILGKWRNLSAGADIYFLIFFISTVVYLCKLLLLGDLSIWQWGIENLG